VWGSTKDVFVHIEVLRRSGFADLGPGEAMGLRIIDGHRGRMAAEVVAYDNAKPKDNGSPLGSSDARWCQVSPYGPA
jgi:CspA family cold shock protein